LFLHSLKPRGLKIATTTLFLWDRVLRERPLHTRLGWLLRKNLLLIPAIACRARVDRRARRSIVAAFRCTSGDLVVVLDLSASMKAKGKAARASTPRAENFSL
jgi:hypothetical protein